MQARAERERDSAKPQEMLAATKKMNLRRPEMLHIVCYDISEDKTRHQMSECLLDFGVRIQESVFECVLDGHGYVRMMEAVNKVPIENTDRCLPLIRNGSSLIWVWLSPMRNNQFLIRFCLPLIRNGSSLIWVWLSPMRNSQFLIRFCLPLIRNGSFLIWVWLSPMRNSQFLIGFCLPRIRNDSSLIWVWLSPMKNSRSLIPVWLSRIR